MPISLQDGLTWFISAIVLYIIICLCVSIYARYGSDRGKSDSWWYNFPAWVQPTDFWTSTLFNIGPASYSFISNVSVLDTSVLSGAVYSNTTVKECLLKCEANKSCQGFTYVGNTCSLLSSFDGILPDASSNVIYFANGSEPSKTFLLTPGTVPLSNTINISSIAIPVSTNVATYTTVSNHGLKTGDYVNISGTSGINGMNVVTVTDSTHFTLPYIVTSDTSYSAGGTASRVVSLFTSTDTLYDCATKCYSNVTCTGFTTSPQTCIQYMATTLTVGDVSNASTASNTYIYSSIPISAYTDQFWT